MNELSKVLIDSLGVTKETISNSSRIETRIFNLYSPNDISGIEQWLAYISHIGKMNSKVVYTLTGEVTKSEYYYFTSNISIDVFKKIRRHHWAIENSLQWILDNSFKEDRMRIKKGSASENMNLLRKFVLNVLALTNCTNESVSASRDELKYDTPQQLLYKIIRSIA